MVAPTKQEALDRFYPGWLAMNAEMAARRGWPAPDDEAFLAGARARRVLRRRPRRRRRAHRAPARLHGPHAPLLADGLRRSTADTLLESITLLATEVKPRVERLLAKK
jgi:hypothetical protein